MEVKVVPVGYVSVMGPCDKFGGSVEREDSG